MSNINVAKYSVAAVVLAALLFAFGGSAMAYTVADFGPTTLRVGSSGMYVGNLQAALSACGQATTADQSFGPATRASVVAFQSSKGLTADGLVGMGTKGALASCGTVSGGTTTVAGCLPGYVFSPTTGQSCSTGTTTGGSTGSGTVTGGAGSVEDYTLISNISGEEVGEDESVEVAGLEITADDGSDLKVTAVKLVFDEGTAGSDFEDYADEVSVLFNGDEVATVDGDEFNDDNSWSKTITLDGDSVVEAGDTADLVVAVKGVSNLDSSDVSDTWTVDFRTIRFVDGLGASTSEDPSTGTRTFSFESFATATGAELKIASDDDAINDDHILNVHATDESESEDVEVASFTLEAEGDSDLEVKLFGVNIDVTGAAHVDDVIAGGTSPAIYLEIEGERYGTATYFDDADDTDVGTDEDVLFDDVDYVIAAGETVNAKIIVDLLAVDTDLDEGDTIAVTLGETETDQATLVEAEDESGEELVDADITGSMDAGAHAIYDKGIMVSNFEVTEETLVDDGADDDTGTFTIKFTVEAFDGTIYVSDTAAATTAADSAIDDATSIVANLYRIEQGGTATTADLSSIVSYTTGDGASSSSTGGNIELADGETTRVTIQVSRVNSGDANDSGLFQAFLGAIGWSTSDTVTTFNNYYFDLQDVESDAVSLN